MCGRLKIKVEGLSEWKGTRKRVGSDGGGHTGGRKNRRGIAKERSAGTKGIQGSNANRGTVKLLARERCRFKGRSKHRKVAAALLSCRLRRPVVQYLTCWGYRGGVYAGMPTF